MIGALLGLVLVVLGEPALSSAPDWRTPDPENTLMIETTAGEMIIEMHPELAPQAVDRIKALARAKVYDGLLFHRVIDHFVDQTGNPNNKDGGGSSLPDLKPEFDARIAPSEVTPVARPAGALFGFLGSLPVESSAKLGPDGRARTWGLYCAGVAGMGRQASEQSANSEIFFMRDPARRLDHAYTVWGRTIVGLDVVRRMQVGFPPQSPDKMVSVRVMADLPLAQRPGVRVLDPKGPAFKALIAKTRQLRGADFSPCEIDVPAKIAQSGALER